MEGGPKGVNSQVHPAEQCTSQRVVLIFYVVSTRTILTLSCLLIKRDKTLVLFGYVTPPGQEEEELNDKNGTSILCNYLIRRFCGLVLEVVTPVTYRKGKKRPHCHTYFHMAKTRKSGPSTNVHRITGFNFLPWLRKPIYKLFNQSSKKGQNSGTWS